MIFGVSCEVFVWKASKSRGFCMVDVSKVSNKKRQQGLHRATGSDHGRHHPPIPPSPPPPPHRAERQMQVQAGMCKKSRFGKTTVKTAAKCDTHRKQQKKQKRQVAFAWTSSPAPIPGNSPYYNRNPDITTRSPILQPETGPYHNWAAICTKRVPTTTGAFFFV